MKRISVSSSNIASVGYDEASRTLEVEFLNRSVYQYFQVDSSVYTAMVGASSVGSYFARNVRDVYRWTRL